MKNKDMFIFTSTLVSILVLVLILGCSMGGIKEESLQSQFVEYKSFVGEDLYILKIFENTEVRAADYTPKAGDTYELWLKKDNVGKEELISSGTIAIVPKASGSNGAIYKLTDDKGTNLQVTVVTATGIAKAGDEEATIPVMSTITGTIAAEGDAEAITIPATTKVTPQPPADVKEITEIPPAPRPATTSSGRGGGGGGGGGSGGGGGTTTKTLSEITITTLPTKTTYLIGEAINLSGLQVSNTYSDGSTGITADFTVSSINTFRAGVIPVTISAKSNGSVKTSFNITVVNELMNTGLPVIYINTNNVPILSKVDWVNMNFKLVDAKDPSNNMVKTTLADNLPSNQQDNIRGRGNYTWDFCPKKPYRIRFREDTSLFGLTAARNWVLLANYKDSTLLSGTIAFELGHRFGFPFTNHAKHVEVVLNGEYQGSYVLTEHARVGAGRVEIDPINGYLVELDTYFDEDPKFEVLMDADTRKLPVMITSPDFGADINLPEYEFVINSLKDFGEVLSEASFPNNNYGDLIDIDNFVDFIMINEIVQNVEIGHPKSTFMYKKDVGEKIKMGPLWDFDFAFGLDEGTSVMVSTAEGRLQGGWLFSRFFKDPVFASKYKARWNEKYGDIAGISAFIDTMYEQLKISQSLNSRRWYAVDYAYEINKLKTWWGRRVAYLNTAINAE